MIPAQPTNNHNRWSKPRASGDDPKMGAKHASEYA